MNNAIHIYEHFEANLSPYLMTMKLLDIRCFWQLVTAVPPMGDAHFAYLRLGEHVQAPGAHPAVCGHGDQVVGILGADHVHAVHWVLRNAHNHRYTQKGSI